MKKFAGKKKEREKKKEKVHIIKSGNRGKDGERGEKIVVKWWQGLNGGQVRETTAGRR